MKSKLSPALVTNLILSVGALVVALFVSALVLKLAGHPPVEAMKALALGAFGGRYECTETAIKTCPLILTGLAVSLAFRSGLFNIGAEGQLLMGALASIALGNAVGASVGNWFMPALLVAAFIAGGLWAGVAAWLKTERAVSEVISTLMLNFIAAQLIGYLVHGPLQEATRGYPQTEMLPAHLWLARILAPTRLHAGIPIAVAVAVAVHILLFFTPFGLRLRVSGTSPKAARVAGISPRTMTWATLFLSGGLAGLAGGVEALGVGHRLYEQFSPGYGFMAIAVALLARLNPLGVVPAAVFFGALEIGAGALQRATSVSAALAGVVEAVVIFAVVAGNAPPVRRWVEEAIVGSRR